MDLTAEQAAEIAGVARTTIIYAIKNDHLPATRFGAGATAPWSIAPADLDAWMEQREQQGTAPPIDGLVSLAEAARRLGLSRQWLHWQVTEKKVQGERHGRYWYLKE